MGSWWPTSTSRDGSRISEKVGRDPTVAHSVLFVFRLVFVFVLKMLTNLQRPTAVASAVVEK